MSKTITNNANEYEKATLKTLLNPIFDEIKGMLAENSLSKVADQLNESYDLNISRQDIANYLYNIRTDFDVQEYRKNLHAFDIKSARTEDATKQF